MGLDQALQIMTWINQNVRGWKELELLMAYCKDDLPSECSTFSSRNRVNSDISTKKKKTDPLSLYEPPSFDEEEGNSQPANSFDDQRKMSVTVESYRKDDLSSEYSSFSGYDLSKCEGK